MILIWKINNDEGIKSKEKEERIWIENRGDKDRIRRCEEIRRKIKDNGDKVMKREKSYKN